MEVQTAQPRLRNRAAQTEVRQSLIDTMTVDVERFFYCALDEINRTCPSPISLEHLVVCDNMKFASWNLVLSVLTQQKLQNPFNRQPLSQDVVKRLADDCCGITVHAFEGIWTNVRNRMIRARIPEIHLNNSEHQTDNRFKNLNELLTKTGMKSGNEEKRQAFLQLLQKEEVWQKKFPSMASASSNRH
jgi:hypothetical protein